jgi:hypothetical protein
MTMLTCPGPRKPSNVSSGESRIALIEMGESVATGFARGPRSARHRHRLEPAEASVAEIIGDQELAAP